MTAKNKKMLKYGAIAALLAAAYGYWKIKKARAADGTAVAFDFGEFLAGLTSQPVALLKAAFADPADLATALASSSGSATTTDTSAAW